MIEYKNIYKSFNGLKVLEDINCVIPPQKTTVIIGPSGVGKSVFLKLLVGLVPPDKGQILVEGEDIINYSDVQWYKFREKIGMLFQEGALFDSMTVFENVAFPLKQHTKKKEEELRSIVEKKLDLVGLKGILGKMPSELSGGMKRRVGLARAIALEPEILVFDEPNTGLDPIMSDSVDSLILDMKKELGITFVVISHDIVGTFNIADNVGMLFNARLIEFDSKKRFLNSSNEVVQNFLKRNMESIVK